MAKVLFLTARVPFPLTQGMSLRVFNLCKELSGSHECYLAAVEQGDTAAVNKLENYAVFKEIDLMPPPPRASLLRHLRISEGDLNRMGRKTYYRQIAEQLQRLVQRYDIDVVVAVTLKMAEYLDPLQNVKKIIDEYDCVSLTLERELETMKGNVLWRKLSQRVALARLKRQESKLVVKYDLVTTISPVDLEVLRNLNSCTGSAIQLLPNGVTLPGENLEVGDSIDNSIAFWGDLGFLPNKVAVEYFFSKIYCPYLEPRGVQWYVIGKNASRSMAKMAHSSKNIHLTGYVDNLYAFVGRIPVMVNPMIMGSGLKNKVLEALALRRAVVSTSMGVEALDLQNGEHYISADSPAEFATSVLNLLDDESTRRKLGCSGYEEVVSKYSWPVVSKDFSEMILSLINS